MTDQKPQTVEEYISSYPEEQQAILRELRARISTYAPDAEAVISYGIPTFKQHGKILVHFAGYKKHIGFYATPTGHEAFADQLSEYKQGKGSVQFPLNEPMPWALIEDIVKFRIQQTLEK